MFPRRPGAAAVGDQVEIHVGRRVGGEQRRKESDDDESGDDDGADDCSRVPDEPVESLVPEPSRRCLERDLLRFDLDDAHQRPDSRMRGFRKPYEMSTMRFTTTTITAMKRIPPWRTG